MHLNTRAYDTSLTDEALTANLSFIDEKIAKMQTTIDYYIQLRIDLLAEMQERSQQK